MKSFSKQISAFLILLFLPLWAIAKDLVIYGGSFNPPTAFHIEFIKNMARRPDTQVQVMVNTAGPKRFKLSALQRAEKVAAAVGPLENVNITFQAYSKYGTVPVILRALASQEFETVFYSIGGDVWTSWKGQLPQLGQKLTPPRNIHYLIAPRIDPETALPEVIVPLNPQLETVLDLEPTNISSSDVRDYLGGIAIDAETDLAALPHVSEPVRQILARDHTLRLRRPEQMTYFEEYFTARFLALRGRLAHAFPQYASIIDSTSAPAFEPTGSLLAWDESILRQIVDAIVNQQGLFNYTLEEFPLDGRFADSLLFYEMISKIHPGYAVFSPHRLYSATKETTTAALLSDETINKLTYPARYSAHANTADLHQLPSGIYNSERRKIHDLILGRFEENMGNRGSADLRGNKRKPRVVLTCGASGAGKSTVLNLMNAEGDIDWPVVNMDDFRASIIAADARLQDLQRVNTLASSVQTNDESSYLQGIQWARLMRDQRDFQIDGTLSATEYFAGVINRMRAQGYEISLVYVTAPEDQLLGRVARRNQAEGRSVPEDVVRRSLVGSNKSWQVLAPLVDTAVRISNPNVLTGEFPAPVVEEALVRGQPVELNPGDMAGCGRWLTGR